MQTSIILLFLFTIGIFGKDEKKLQVHLSSGIIEGKWATSTYSPFGNTTAQVYLGIPYAEPPINENRFRKPVRIKKWNGIRQTKQYQSACMSDPGRTFKTKNGGPISEDCLYLNVFTNNYCMLNKNCSVFIVIHGGGYVFESASAFNSDVLINNFVGQNRNIVVVTINYRLGVFGFGHLNGEYGNNADDNVALYDVLESIKWTKREIANFGGSPDRITLGGHSGGAGITSYIAMSPLSKGLIKQQIMMSSAKGGNSKIGNTKATRMVAIQVGCLPETSAPSQRFSSALVKKIFDCLRQVDASKLLAAELNVVYNLTEVFGSPYVDGLIVPDYTETMLNGKNVHKINTMIGTLTAEFLSTLYAQDNEGNPLLTGLNPICAHIGYQLAYPEPETFRKLCLKEYGQKNLPQILSDDLEFHINALKFSEAFYSDQTNVYLYSYSYTGAQEAFNKYAGNGSSSPSHSEDLIYTLGTHRNPDKMLPKDYAIERIYSGMFANFINYGNPSPSKDQPWQRFTPENREYFHIDFDENLKMPGSKALFYERAHNFWNIKIPAIIGNSFPVEIFSKSFDTAEISNYADAYSSHFTNVSTSPYKSWQTLDNQYSELFEFINTLQLEYIFNETRPALRSAKAEPSTTNDENGFNLNLFLAITGICLILVMIIGGFGRWLLTRKRREQYLQFD